MGSRNLICDLDGFASCVEELISDIPESCREASNKAVAQSIRRGVKTVKSKASSGGVHEWSAKYVDGFSSHVEQGVVAVGEIGNKNKPGLVHLLEKGHATLTGRRTRAFPHMAPAFDEIRDDYIRTMDRLVGEALR